MSIHILIPDGSSSWALHVVNCLSKFKDYKLYVLSHKKNTPLKYSRHTFSFSTYDFTDEIYWVNTINNFIEEHQINVILPIAEPEMIRILKFRSQLNDSVRVIPLPTLQSYETAIDKRNLSKFLSQKAIPHPVSYEFKNLTDFQRLKQSLKFPILLKPTNQKGGNGILRFNNLTNLETYFESNNEFANVFLQNYIHGFDIDCSVLCEHGEILAHTIQKGFIQGKNPYGPQTGLEFVKNNELFKVVHKLMMKLNWSGIAHIDLRFDENENNYKVIEVNARFWDSLEASKSVGVNFPELAIKMALGESIHLIPYKSEKFMRFTGLLKYLRKHPAFIFRFGFIWNQTELKSVLSNPFPKLYLFILWAQSKLKIL
ncbi:ATP-grasp domain-containing protein [Paucihalobacter sp.]|uniref:ATP-grasp domain-containing protein n=1 Tax=Paucihalobacter sp. TaxID=2850405 RepID=UPI002FE3EF2F